MHIKNNNINKKTMKNNGKENKKNCFFCRSTNSLFQITEEINDILFKTNFSNIQSQIYYFMKQNLMNIKEEEKIIPICENCLTKSMNFHYFGIENFPNMRYDFIDNSKTAYLSFLQLMENYKIFSRKILESNFQIYKDVKNLIDYINSHSKIFYSQFGNRTSLMIIEQLYSLIGYLTESINSNNNSINLETIFFNNVKNYIEQMFARIDSLKMLNYPNIGFDSRQFCYSHFLNYQSENNYNENVEKNIKILKELTNDNLFHP